MLAGVRPEAASRIPIVAPTDVAVISRTYVQTQTILSQFQCPAQAPSWVPFATHPKPVEWWLITSTKGVISEIQ